MHKKLLIGFIITSAFVGAWGLLQVLTGIDFNHTLKTYSVPEAWSQFPEWLQHALSARNGRAVGPRSHPLTYVEGLIPGLLILPFWIGKKYFTERRMSRPLILGIISFVLIAAGFIATQGRAAWLGVFAGMIVGTFLSPRKIRNKIFILMFLVVGLVLAGSPHIRGRALSIVKSNSGSYGDQESKSVRLSIWKESLNHIREKPLFGYGIRGMKVEVESPPIAAGKVWTEAHNIFLQVLIERGVIGLSLLLWILIIGFKLAQRSPPYWREIFFGCLTAFVICGLTESWMKDKEVAMIFWTMIGGLEAVRLNSLRMKNDKEIS